MARRFGGRNVGGRIARRATDWFFSLESVGYTTVAANSKVLLALTLPAAMSLVAPATIVRTRGVISIRSDQSAASEDQVGAFGFGLVNPVAASLGVTGLPGPASEALWDGWFVHQWFAATNADQAAPFNMMQIIDSKAMRKIDADEAIVVMIENSSAANGFQVSTSFRMLLKAG